MKIGDRIIITKNKPNSRGAPIDYHYGSDTQRVPLRTTGTITNINQKKIYCTLDNGLEWDLHPDEISLIDINEEARQHDKRKTK